MSHLVKLLEQGRKILADKEAETKRQTEKHAAAMNAIWEGARTKVLDLFSPLGPMLVQPMLPPNGWDPHFEPDYNVAFYVRPFGYTAGKISVRLRGTNVDKAWRWDVLYGETAFLVEYDFAVGKDRDIYGRSEDRINSLPEALAVCERYGADYRAQKDRLQATEASKSQPQKQTTPDAEVLAAIRAWHDWLHSDE